MIRPILLLALAVLSNSAAATALAVIRNSDVVVIAADSRATGPRGEIQPDVCKIRISGNTAYAALNFTGHVPTGFDLFADVFNAISGENNLTAMAQHLEEKTVPNLKAAIESLSQQAPENVRIMLANDFVASVVMARFEEDETRFAYVRFGIKSTTATSAQIRADIKVCPVNCGSDTVSVFAPNIAGAVKEQGCGSDPVGCLRDANGKAFRFVQQQVDRGVQEIAGPISELLVSRSGIQWLRNGTCNK